MTLRAGQSDYSYPAASFCHVFEFPMAITGDGQPDPNNPNPALVWSNRFFNDCPTGPNEELPDDPENPLCNYWEDRTNSLIGPTIWRFLKEITLDKQHLTFRWSDCFYKFAVLKLFPPGSQIVITFKGIDGAWDVGPGSRYPEDGGEIRWAGCIYFVSDSYSRSEDEVDAYELRLNIPQFEPIIGTQFPGGPETGCDPGSIVPGAVCWCNGPSYGCSGGQGGPQPGGAYGGDPYGLAGFLCLDDPPLNFDDYFGTPGSASNTGLYDFPKDVILGYQKNWFEATGTYEDCEYIDPPEWEFPDGETFDAPPLTFCPCFSLDSILGKIEDDRVENCMSLLRMEVRICTDGEHITTF